MPRIPPLWVNNVVYMYSNEDDALTGSEYGASGFLVSMNSDAVPERSYVYFVTNRHVIEDGFAVPRVNLKNPTSDDKRTSCFRLSPSSWVKDPLNDLAVHPFPV